MSVAKGSRCLLWLLLPLQAHSQVTLQADAGVRPGERDVSLNVKKFASNFFSDQKKIYTFPAKLEKGRHLIPTLAVAAATGRGARRLRVKKAHDATATVH